MVTQQLLFQLHQRYVRPRSALAASRTGGAVRGRVEWDSSHSLAELIAAVSPHRSTWGEGRCPLTGLAAADTRLWTVTIGGLVCVHLIKRQVVEIQPPTRLPHLVTP